jgi:hypothetical protein
MMARQKASLRAAPAALAEALQLVVSMTPQGPGQQTAQREIIGALALQLPFCFEVRSLSGSLVSSAPE